MIDLHCHILPAIDDGAPDMETTLKMLAMAEDDGISHIAASPHFRYGEEPGQGQILELLQSVQEEAAKRGISVKLCGAADIRLTYELFGALENRDMPTIAQSRYFLLELPELLPPHLDDFIFEAGIKGYVPIITHPERNYSILAQTEKAEALSDAGALLQLTAMSITGEFGRQIRRCSMHLLQSGCVDFVASDAHSINRRVPVLSKAFGEIAAEFGRDAAQKLFIGNPMAVIENREI